MRWIVFLPTGSLESRQYISFCELGEAPPSLRTPFPPVFPVLSVAKCVFRLNQDHVVLLLGIQALHLQRHRFADEIAELGEALRLFIQEQVNHLL